MKESGAIKSLATLLALAIFGCFSGCQTTTLAHRREIRATLHSYHQALNNRSFDQLEPLLSDEIRVEGMTDELSRAGLKSGMQWPESQIRELQVLRISGRPAAADVALYVRGGVMMLRIGFDDLGKIRSIDEAPLWKPSAAIVKAPFRTPFTESNGLMFVKGFVNGRAGYLLLDTGSSDLLLNSKYFFPEKGGTGMQGMMSTVTGLSPHPARSFVQELKWGGFVAREIRGQLHEFSQMETPKISPLLGAIGFEQLRNVAVSVDWKARSVGIAPSGTTAEPSGPQAVIPFSYFLHTPVLYATIGQKTFPMLLDTGAQVNLLPKSSALDTHFKNLRILTKISDGGSAGETASPIGIVDEMHVGGVLFRDMPFAIFDVPYLRGNGILGSPLFQDRRVRIDFPKKTVSIW